MVDYLEYGAWEGDRIAICFICKGEIDQGAMSWTVEYSDGESRDFHSECLDGQSARLMEFLMSVGKEVIPMKCGKCGDLLSSRASTLQQTLPDDWYQIRVPGHGAVTICYKCHKEHKAIIEACKESVTRAWFGLRR